MAYQLLIEMFHGDTGQPEYVLEHSQLLVLHPDVEQVLPTFQFNTAVIKLVRMKLCPGPSVSARIIIKTLIVP